MKYIIRGEGIEIVLENIAHHHTDDQFTSFNRIVKTEKRTWAEGMWWWKKIHEYDNNSYETVYVIRNKLIDHMEIA